MDILSFMILEATFFFGLVIVFWPDRED